MRHITHLVRSFVLFCALTSITATEAQFLSDGTASFFAAPRRMVTADPMVQLNSAVQGTLLVAIGVNREGKVVSAKVAQKGTTCTDSSVFQQAVEAARKFHFDAVPTAPELQRGKIVWDFELSEELGTQTIEEREYINVDVPPPPVMDEDQVFSLAAVQEQPQFPGGQEMMFRYITKQLKYPDDAFETGVQGRVYVEFTVKEDGRLTDVVLLRGVYPSMDREALRVVKAMPNWIPGKMQGKPVRTRYILPIAFVLR